MFNMEDIFVTVNSKTYKATCCSCSYSPDEVGPTLEIETVLNPYYEVSNPETSKLIANIHADIHLNTIPEIVDVIFNDPATIVFWSDNTKTVVKTQDGEPYDPEKGMAMAFCKKLMGNNKRDYYHTFLHYLKKYDKQQVQVDLNPNYDISGAIERLAESFRTICRPVKGDM